MNLCVQDPKTMTDEELYTRIELFSTEIEKAEKALKLLYQNFSLVKKEAFMRLYGLKELCKLRLKPDAQRNLRFGKRDGVLLDVVTDEKGNVIRFILAHTPGPDREIRIVINAARIVEMEVVND